MLKLDLSVAGKRDLVKSAQRAGIENVTVIM